MKSKAILAACCALLLTGCQLARTDLGEEKDKLIGVFVTTEHLDLFDIESYVEDHMSASSGGAISMEDAQAYQGRMYAALVTEAREDGTPMGEYVFEGLEGIPFFCATYPAAGGQDSYIGNSADERISDSHMSINGGDEESGIKLEGTVYLTRVGLSSACYLNPVYQAEDGGVYLTAGTGIATESPTEGTLMTQTMEEKRSVTENGQTKTESTSVAVTVAFMLPPEKIVVLQMGADGRLADRAEYEPGALPDEITPEPGVEYLVVETHKQGGGVARSIHGGNAGSFETFYAREDGISAKDATSIMWPGAEAENSV